MGSYLNRAPHAQPIPVQAKLKPTSPKISRQNSLTPKGPNSRGSGRKDQVHFDTSMLAEKRKVKFSGDTEAIVNSWFAYFDKDGTNYLGRTEFANMLTRIVKDLGGQTPTTADIEDIMYQLDANGDGQISKQEFAPLIEKVIELLGGQNSRARFLMKQRKTVQPV